MRRKATASNTVLLIKLIVSWSPVAQKLLLHFKTEHRSRYENPFLTPKRYCKNTRPFNLGNSPGTAWENTVQNNERIKANVSWNNTLSLLMLHSSLFTAVILVVTLAHAAGAISHFFFFFFFRALWWYSRSYGRVKSGQKTWVTVVRADTNGHYLHKFTMNDGKLMHGRFFVCFVPGGYSLEFLVGVCRPHLQIQTQFQTKKGHFPHPFSDLASKIHTHFQTWHCMWLNIAYASVLNSSQCNKDE